MNSPSTHQQSVPASRATVHRARWAALGAAVAVSLGAGGFGLVNAAIDSGPMPVFQAIEPCRLADTRTGDFTVGDRDTPLGADETLTLSGRGAVGNCDLPTDTLALALNVTTVNATMPTFVQLMPEGGTAGASSNLNPVPNEPPTPNAVLTALADNGNFSVYNYQGTVDVIIDVAGVFRDHVHPAEVDLSARGIVSQVAAPLIANGSIPVGPPRTVVTPAPGTAKLEVELDVVAGAGSVVCVLNLNGEAINHPGVPNGGDVSFTEYIVVDADMEAITTVVICTLVGAPNGTTGSVTGTYELTYYPTPAAS